MARFAAELVILNGPGSIWWAGMALFLLNYFNVLATVVHHRTWRP